MIEEQTTMSEGTVVPKEGKDLHSETLQNPSDPDATFRTKYEDNIGYVANLVETFDEYAGVINTYDYKPNTYADSKFCKDILQKMGEQEDVTLLVHGGYYSDELSEVAKKQGIEIVPTELVGKKKSTDKIPYSAFEIDEEENVIKACPAGNKPRVSYNSSKSYTAKFK